MTLPRWRLLRGHWLGAASPHAGLLRSKHPQIPRTRENVSPGLSAGPLDSRGRARRVQAVPAV